MEDENGRKAERKTKTVLSKSQVFIYNDLMRTKIKEKERNVRKRNVRSIKKNEGKVVKFN